MKITVTGGELKPREQFDIIAEIKKKNPDKDFTAFEFKVDGEYVDVHYEFKTKEFERIRRITGYLVGTLDRFNDAKRTEVEDRVKHHIGNSENDADILNQIK